MSLDSDVAAALAFLVDRQDAWAPPGLSLIGVFGTDTYTVGAVDSGASLRSGGCAATANEVVQ